MFRSQRIEEEKGKDGLASDGKEENGRNDLAIVNRIILYIDDLDRCPPEKVVEGTAGDSPAAGISTVCGSGGGGCTLDEAVAAGPIFANAGFASARAKT